MNRAREPLARARAAGAGRETTFRRLRAWWLVPLAGLSLAGPAARGQSTCDPSREQQEIAQETATAGAALCDLDAVLAVYLDHYEAFLDRCEMAKDLLEDAEQLQAYAATIDEAESKAEQRGAAGSAGDVVADVEALSDLGNSLNDVNRTIDPTSGGGEVDSNRAVLLCQSNLEWRKSKIWMQKILDCHDQLPPPVPPDPVDPDAGAPEDG